MRGPWLALVGWLGACEAHGAPLAPPAQEKPLPALAVERRLVRHGQARWWVAELDLARVQLRLVGQRPGEPRSFSALLPYLQSRGQTLLMATNAGIFDPARHPLGLHVQDGEVLSPLSTADGEGNFFLKPNGVFWLDQAGAHVAASADYAPAGKVQLATQSGPLLLANGRLHPSFSRASTSLRVRSAVGVDARGHVLLALSLDRVTFYESATLFRDVLGCAQALYLDGEISDLWDGRGTVRPEEYGGLLVVTPRD